MFLLVILELQKFINVTKGSKIQNFLITFTASRQPSSRKCGWNKSSSPRAVIKDLAPLSHYASNE